MKHELSARIAIDIIRQLPGTRDEGQRPLVALTFEAWDALVDILEHRAH